MSRSVLMTQKIDQLRARERTLVAILQRELAPDVLSRVSSSWESALQSSAAAAIPRELQLGC